MLSTNVSHEDELAFFPSPGITVLEIPHKKFFHNFYRNKGVELAFSMLHLKLGILVKI